MKSLHRTILEQLIEGSAEPLVVARIDRPDWPVVLCNPAFARMAGGQSAMDQPFADVIEQLVGRELALEVSETVRSGQESSIPVQLGSREYLMELKPLPLGTGAGRGYYAAYWRGAGSFAGPAADGEVQQALIEAKRRIRDLSRDDPVTGLLNASAFREVLAHDWAVAARGRASLALVAFTIDDFDAYLGVFGRHATDSCLRRVAQAIKRCLRRASDVAARADNGTLLVLSHASDEAGVRDFASRIATAVRELGMHHPRSAASRFVTVSFKIGVVQADQAGANADAFLKRVLGD